MAILSGAIVGFLPRKINRRHMAARRDNQGIRVVDQDFESNIPSMRPQQNRYADGLSVC